MCVCVYVCLEHDFYNNNNNNNNNDEQNRVDARQAGLINLVGQCGRVDARGAPTSVDATRALYSVNRGLCGTAGQTSYQQNDWHVECSVTVRAMLDVIYDNPESRE